MAPITNTEPVALGRVIYLQTKLRWLVVKPKPSIGYLDEQRQAALRLWFRNKPSISR